MATKGIQDLLRDMQNDETLCQRFRAAQDVETFVAQAAEDGYEVTAQELADLAGSLDPTEGDLSDGDLDQVAGGAVARSGRRLSRLLSSLPAVRGLRFRKDIGGGGRTEIPS